jgi:tetratricopeptide (TPR) repeat protein
VVERRTGDSSLSDAVRAIDSAASKVWDVRELARGHRENAAARASYAADDNRGAEQAFERAYRLSRASRALAAWAAYSRGSPLVYLGKLDVADASVRRAIARADTARHPSVAARARWVRATTLLRRGRYEESIQLAREAATLYTRTGERENLGAVLTIVADAERLIGDPARTFSAAGEAIRTLRPFRASEWLHNALYTAGRYTAGDGLPRAARRIHDEDVLVAERHPDPVYGAEALIERARAHAAVGDEAAAEADVKKARELVLRLPSGPREWFQADLQLGAA